MYKSSNRLQDMDKKRKHDLPCFSPDQTSCNAHHKRSAEKFQTHLIFAEPRPPIELQGALVPDTTSISPLRRLIPRELRFSYSDGTRGAIPYCPPIPRSAIASGVEDSRSVVRKYRTSPQADTALIVNCSTIARAFGGRLFGVRFFNTIRSVSESLVLATGSMEGCGVMIILQHG